MSAVLNCLLCALVGSLLVSSWILASVMYLLRGYLIERIELLRSLNQESKERSNISAWNRRANDEM